MSDQTPVSSSNGGSDAAGATDVDRGSEPAGQTLPTVESLAEQLQGLQGKLEHFDRKQEILKADVIKNRHRFKGLRTQIPGAAAEGEAGDESGLDPAPQSTPSGITRDDLRAHRAIGALTASMPKEIIERVDEMEEAGAPLPEIKAFLEAVQIGQTFAAKANGNNGAHRARQPGNAASAAHLNATNHPQSVSEYNSLSRDEKMKLRADPSFDPQSMKRINIPRS